MLPLEERMDILNDEIEILEEQGWTVVSRTDTTCFLSKEVNAIGCLSAFLSFESLLPSYGTSHKTRFVEITPEDVMLNLFQYCFRNSVT